jgi:hypothetical protein
MHLRVEEITWGTPQPAGHDVVVVFPMGKGIWDGHSRFVHFQGSRPNATLLYPWIKTVSGRDDRGPKWLRDIRQCWFSEGGGWPEAPRPRDVLVQLCVIGYMLRQFSDWDIDVRQLPDNVPDLHLNAVVAASGPAFRPPMRVAWERVLSEIDRPIRPERMGDSPVRPGRPDDLIDAMRYTQMAYRSPTEAAVLLTEP